MIVVFRQICKKGDKQTNFCGNLPHLPEEDEDDEALRPAKNQFVFRTTHLGQYQYWLAAGSGPMPMHMKWYQSSHNSQPIIEDPSSTLPHPGQIQTVLPSVSTKCPTV